MNFLKLALGLVVLVASAAACTSSTGDDGAASDSNLTAGVPGLPPPVEHCGGFAGFTCSSDDQFCAYETKDMCGAADAMGTCKPRPQACAEIYFPVCGCDGKTYSNACSANAAGTAVARETACN